MKDLPSKNIQQILKTPDTWDIINSIVILLALILLGLCNTYQKRREGQSEIWDEEFDR